MVAKLKIKTKKFKAIAIEKAVFVSISPVGIKGISNILPLMITSAYGKNSNKVLKRAMLSKSKLCFLCIIFKTYNLYRCL